MPRTIIAGNWKMHKNTVEARLLMQGIVDGIKHGRLLPEIVVCPPFTCLQDVLAVTSGTPIKVGAQNMDYRDAGAFTGEISPTMLADLGVRYIIIGHSERRKLFSETDANVNLKLIAALKHKLSPIVCVGETLAEREAGLTDSVITHQVTAALVDITRPDISPLIIAYEPLWAIGTGKNCPVQEANRVAAVIRAAIDKLFNAKAETGETSLGSTLPILYGGSVTSSTIDELMNEPQIDGALVGGASLKAKEFLPIVMGGVPRTRLTQAR